MIKIIKQKTYNFLRESERYTKTDMVYLFKGGSWLTLGQIVSSICSFLLAIAFANLLPKETYGSYRYVLSIAGLLAIPTLSGINTAIVQAVARGYEGSFIKGLKTKIRWGLLGGLASLILSSYYYFNDNITLTFAFLITGIFIPFMDSFNIYGALLIGKKKFKISTIYNIIIKILSFIIIISVLFITNNIFLIIFTYFLSNTLLRLLFLFVTIKKIKINRKEDSETIPYGKHLSLIDIISIIASQLDKILVFHYLGAIELAIYAFAIAIPEQIKSLLKNMSTLALPKFSEKSIEKIKKTIFKKMAWMSLFIALGTVFYIIAAPYIYKLFFPQYIESIFYSQLFSISLIAAITILPTSALQAKIAKKELYKLNIYSPIIQIVLLFFFIYFYGILGAIIARVLGRFIGLVISYWLFKKFKLKSI